MKYYIQLLGLLFLSNLTYAQCDGGSSAGTITPTSGYQTVAFSSGEYFTVNVQCGYTYYFSTSYNGGTAGGNDTQITINQTDSSTDLAFDDDGGSGYESDLTWTSDFTGTVQVLVTEYFCITDGSISGTLAYNQTAGTPSTDFNLSATSCSSASATITGATGGTFSFNPAPGDGATINTTTGSISNGIAGNTYNVEYTVCSSSTIESITMPGSNNTFDFTLSACDQATPIQLTGEPGGSFSFTTNPGGGTSINSSTGIINNADPGDTYSIDYDVCGITTTFNYTVPSNLSDFEMIEVCGGGVPDIYGVQGGTFAFAPDPSDGSQISATTGVISNGVVGSTYTVEYTVCGTTSSSQVIITSNNCFTMNGDAQQIVVNGESCIQLTDETNNQTGCAWNGSTIDFSQNFSLSLDYYFGDNIGGADGNTFTFQPSSSTACGQNGGQLGAGGISNSLSIEFDTYDNDNPSHIYDRLCDHVAIEVDGNHQNGVPAAGPECAKPDGGNIDDGGIYAVEIQWDAATQTLAVYFNGSFVLDYTDDVVTNVFGGVSNVYWGATSATGGLNNLQYFCPSTIVILPAELVSFSSECVNESAIVKWETVNERDLDMYVLEYTYDGHIYYPIQYINPVGNEPDVINEYQVDLGNTDTSNKYFRIKIVDNNNTIDYSNFISIKKCSDSELAFYGSMKDQTFSLQSVTNEEFDFQLYNSLGQLVLEGSSQNGHVNMFLNLTKGLYFAKMKAESGINESIKLINN